MTPEMTVARLEVQYWLTEAQHFTATGGAESLYREAMTQACAALARLMELVESKRRKPHGRRPVRSNDRRTDTTAGEPKLTGKRAPVV